MSKEERAKDVLKSALVAETTAKEAVSRAIQGTGATSWAATRALHSLLDEKKVTISDPSPPATTIGYLSSPYSFWFWGTMACLAVTLASIYAFPSASPFIYVRYVFGSIAVLFLPGYALIEALYPKKEDLDGLERLALSIGLSLALVPLVGLLLNYTPWGIRLDPIVASLALLDVALAVLGSVRKESYIRLASKAGG